MNLNWNYTYLVIDLSTFKYATSFLIAFLAIVAVFIDFKIPPGNKLKKISWYYIGVCGFLMLSNVLLEKFDDSQRTKGLQKNFTSVMNHTDTVLISTEYKLNQQFERLSLLNNQIDSHLLNTSKTINLQLDQAASNQMKIKNLTEQSNKDLQVTISSLSQIMKQQEVGLRNLVDISEISEDNLISIKNVFNEVEGLSTPLLPVQFVFKIRYKLYTKLSISWRFHRHGFKIENIMLDMNFKSIKGNKMKDRYAETNNFNLAFSFYEDSTYKNKVVDYFNSDSLSVDLRGSKLKSKMLYEESNALLVREVTVTCENIISNPSQIKSLSELLKKDF